MRPKILDAVVVVVELLPPPHATKEVARSARTKGRIFCKDDFLINYEDYLYVFWGALLDVAILSESQRHLAAHVVAESLGLGGLLQAC